MHSWQSEGVDFDNDNNNDYNNNDYNDDNNDNHNDDYDDNNKDNETTTTMRLQGANNQQGQVGVSPSKIPSSKIWAICEFPTILPKLSFLGILYIHTYVQIQ